MKGYSTPAVKKAFEILKFIATAGVDVRVSEIAKALGLGKSTVHAILAALVDVAAVERDANSKKYRTGVTLFELGSSVELTTQLRKVAGPAMEKLWKEARETVFLGVLHNQHLTIVDMVESGKDLAITSRIGAKVSLFAGATGKVFLASMGEKEAMEIIKKKGLPRFTEKTIVDTEGFFKEIRRVRRMGYATDDEEYITGARAIAAPISIDNNRLGAIWVVGFRENMSKSRMEALAGEVKNAAVSISRNLKKKIKQL